VVERLGLAEAGEKWYYVLHPRPVYIVAAEAGGRVNFMAASWVMPLSEEPPRIAAALDKEAYTTRLIIDSGVFTVHVYSVDERDFIYTAGTTSGRELDKVAALGARIGKAPATGAPLITHPRPLAVIEARLHRLLSDLAEDVHLAVADVVAAYADARLFNKRHGWSLRETRIAMHTAGRGFTTNDGLYTARRLLPRTG
jgi:flavin reductase (DIM6/NTAB) family NADH-FMN oxidoreductase RutF